MLECDVCGSFIEEDEAITMEPLTHDAPEGVVCGKMSCTMAYMMQNASWEN